MATPSTDPTLIMVARRGRPRRCGLTLVEVLVVVAIIGLLVGLLMPALNGARESNRKNNCNNNLRQMGLAALAHLEQIGTFPSAGFASGGVTDMNPANGFGELQQGGWPYNLLPFIDLNGLRDQTTTSAGVNAIEKICPPVYSCPTTWSSVRQEAACYSGSGGTPDNRFAPAGRASHLRYPKHVTKDLSGNNVRLSDIDTAPEDQREILRQQTCGYAHAVAGLPYSPTYTSPSDYPSVGPITGVIAVFGRVRAAHLPDGMSTTFLIGERNNSDVGCGPNSRPWTRGFDWFSVKFTNLPPRATNNANSGCNQEFGARHPDTFGMAMCDGSVRQISYAVDLTVFRACGSRNGREAVSLDQ